MIASRKLAVIIMVALAVALVSTGNAYAGNATRMLGFSARDSAMGGATTASSEDTSCLVKNPAGLVRIGNRADVEYMNILPHDVSMRTEGQVVPPALISLSNRSKIQKSTVDYIPAGNAGISYRIPGTDKHPVAVGCGIFTMSGVAADFPSARLNMMTTGAAGANNVYDRMIRIMSMRIAPGIAVALTDKLSLGATGNLGIQGLKTDLARADNYQETSGSGQWDFTPGGGFTIGALYKFNEMLNLGASYESQGWFGYHDKYKDIPLHYVDEPPVISVGLALKPVKQFEFTYDMRYINWTNLKITRNGPASGGFGWGDQWVFAIGGEYTTFKDKLKLRLGYNYGKSPIQAHVVFANAILPVIMEHHLTTGFSYLLMKDLSVDFTWEHHFFASKADNGAGDAYSTNGVGTKVTAAAEILSIGLGYKF